MTKCFRAFGGKVAIWEKPLSGDPLLPFSDPVNHLDAIYFHSDFDYYALAMAAVTTPITHAAVPQATPLSLPQNATTVTAYITRTTADWLLATHNLGYAPRFLVADAAGNELPHGVPIQTAVSGGNEATRKVIPYATATEIRLFEVAAFGSVAIGSLAKTYSTIVFRDPAPVAGAPALDITPTRVRLGHGKIDTNELSLRTPLAGETSVFSLPAGPTVDIQDGQARFVYPDGTIVDINDVWPTGNSNYGGSFTGSGAISVVA